MSSTTSTVSLYQEIAQLDQIIFDAYNNCDLSLFKDYFTEDLEFYHDQSGLILTRNKMLEILASTLCGNSEVKTRRELIAGSLEVYPLHNFGAIEIGAHYYYRSINGQPEKLVEKGKFTHIWKKQDNTWKISRVLSYDHQPISQS